MTTQLTVAELTKIVEDAKKRTEMLTDEEAAALATKVNEKVNIPFILDEKAEFIIIFKAVKFVDAELYKLLPNEYYELIHNATDGISEAEADLMIERLVPLICAAVVLPYVPKQLEEYIIKLILHLIVKALVKGKNIAS